METLLLLDFVLQQGYDNKFLELKYAFNFPANYFNIPNSDQVAVVWLRPNSQYPKISQAWPSLRVMLSHKQ